MEDRIMQKFLSCTSLLLVLALPVGAHAEDAQSILQTMQDKQTARRAGIQNYTVDQSMVGNRALLYYERISATVDGQEVPAFRLVPADEIVRKRSAADFGTPLTPEDIELYASGLDMFGKVLADQANKGNTGANALAGIAAGGDKRSLTSSFSGMLRTGAAEMAADTSDGTAEAVTEAQHMAAFADTARLVGTESINGHKAFLLRADDLKIMQQADGEEFTLNTISMWVDTSEFVPLRLKMEGVARSGKEKTKMIIEKLDADYRTVPGSNMYEPYRQVMRIAGVLSPQQEKEMRGAMEQMAELEQQLESMPASQRAMMERMIGPQLEMARNMASGGGFEVITEVHGIRVNTPEPPSNLEMGKAAIGITQ